MLILTRKKGQEILVGDNIRIVVNRIDRNQVRIGIDCPKNLKILRKEVIK